jgi:hypothetical protein
VKGKRSDRKFSRTNDGSAGETQHFYLGIEL